MIQLQLFYYLTFIILWCQSNWRYFTVLYQTWSYVYQLKMLKWPKVNFKTKPCKHNLRQIFEIVSKQSRAVLVSSSFCLLVNVIETNAAENRRKKRYQGFVISCQISVTNFYTYVHNPSSKKKENIQSYNKVNIWR